MQRIEAAGVAIDDGLLARAARPVDPAERAAAEGLFADWPGLCGAVTAQLRAIAVRREQERLTQVTQAGAAVGDTPVDRSTQFTGAPATRPANGSVLAAGPAHAAATTARSGSARVIAADDK